MSFLNMIMFITRDLAITDCKKNFNYKNIEDLKIIINVHPNQTKSVFLWIE